MKKRKKCFSSYIEILLVPFFVFFSPPPPSPPPPPFFMEHSYAVFGLLRAFSPPHSRRIFLFPPSLKNVSGECPAAGNNGKGFLNVVLRYKIEGNLPPRPSVRMAAPLFPGLATQGKPLVEGCRRKESKKTIETDNSVTLGREKGCYGACLPTLGLFCLFFFSSPKKTVVSNHFYFEDQKKRGPISVLRVLRVSKPIIVKP